MSANEEKHGSPAQVVDLETLLAREVRTSTVSAYQVWVVVACAVAAAFFSLTTNEYIFTTARIPTRCLIPECESELEGTEFEPYWLANAVPFTNGAFDNCQRFANTSAATEWSPDSCPAELFDQSTVVSCDQHVYENTNTAVYTLGLACDEWRRSLLGSARTLGELFSLLLAGVISDRWGRRTALAVVSFNAAWIGILRYFASNYIGYLICSFCESLFGAGAILSCAYILGVELVPTRYRVIAGAFINSVSTLGLIVLALLAWALPNWRHLTLALYTPQLLTLCYIWIFPESISWSLSKGHYKEAEEVLDKIAKSCHCELSEKTKIELKDAAEAATKAKQRSPNTQSEPWLIVLVFRHKSLLLRCVVAPVWWITMTLIFYGLAINAVNISGSPYVNFIAVSAASIPGFWCAVFLMSCLGRKPTLILFYWICCACQIAYIFLPSDQYALSLSVYLIGRMAISAVGSTLYVYTMELFPTACRHRMFGFASMTGRIGSIVAPLTPALGSEVWEPLPFVMFASMALLSGLLVLVAPETLGTRLPDTMEEASNIGHNKLDTRV